MRERDHQIRELEAALEVHQTQLETLQQRLRRSSAALANGSPTQARLSELEGLAEDAVTALEAQTHECDMLKQRLNEQQQQHQHSLRQLQTNSTLFGTGSLGSIASTHAEIFGKAGTTSHQHSTRSSGRSSGGHGSNAILGHTAMHATGQSTASGISLAQGIAIGVSNPFAQGSKQQDDIAAAADTSNTNLMGSSAADDGKASLYGTANGRSIYSSAVSAAEADGVVHQVSNHMLLPA